MRVDLGSGSRLVAISPILAVALVPAIIEGAPFVYVRLANPIDIEEYLW